MALGTFTIGDKAGYQASAPLFVDAVSFAGDSSYPTGGSAFDAKWVAAKHQTRDVLAVLSVDCSGYVPAYDTSTGKLKFYYGDNNNASDGPLIEVPNTTDLSGVTFKVLVVSR